jgi:hypothetical protein
VWGKNADCPTFAVRYADTAYPYIKTMPVSTIALTQYNSGSASPERGILFQLPFPARLSGCLIFSNFLGGADVVLYDSDGSTVLTSLTIDPDCLANTVAGQVYLEFPTSVELSKSTNYRLVVKANSGTNLNLTEITVDSAALMDALPGGQAVHTTHGSSGSWTEITTQRPLIFPLLDALDDAESAGGSAGISQGLHTIASQVAA